MPYLSKTFNHVIADSSVNTWSYEKRKDEIINFSSYLKERKGYTDQFFTDVQEMLQQTNLTITFDDENNTFVFENIIDKEIDLSSIDVNYFVLSSNYNDVLNQLSGKGFDCK